MTVKTLIVDDEPLARSRLRKLLSAEDGVEIVGECANAEEAIGIIESALPDLVFLDVQMPGMDGFQMLSKLETPALPAIIFVTAFDDYALRAFEVHALDYLLKPYSRARFVDAFRHARAQLERESAAAADRRLLGLLAELRARESGGAAAPPAAHEHERLVVKADGRMFFVRPADIDWIEASANYVRLHARGESYQLRESMKNMEERLPRNSFVRIHRSAIVNLDRVRELQPWFHGEYVVILADGTKLTASRVYASRLRELMQ
ncbi:MAG TPA: LytTR family DNA-binding domain-containing protein [Gemmatimonadaceae bacterium]|nr:LytTR family DNA-binding domain-containing protein [Gemmatimonadaceae bacterium]